MGNLKKEVLTAVEHGGLIVLLAGGSELISQAVTHFSGANASSFVDKSVIMAGLAFFQKYLQQQLQKEETL
jgi:hypothetical protein